MKICPVCKGEKYVLDADTGWGNAGPGDYDGPPAPEYSECEYCHGSGEDTGKCAADNCTGSALPDNIFCENCWAEVQADAKAAQEYAAAQVLEF